MSHKSEPMERKSISVKSIFFLIYLILLILDNTACQTHEDVVNIYNNITTGYQKDVFPHRDQTKPLQLHLQTFPMVINSFSETEETISMTMSILCTWKDPQLSWNASSYGGTWKIVISSHRIWLPMLYLSNSVEKLHSFGSESEFYARVTMTGTVYWSPGDILKAKCPTNIVKFPFDSQTCQFNFTIWGVTGDIVECISLSRLGNMMFFTPHSDWKITMHRQYSYKLSTISIFIFELSMKRQPLYYIIIVILPTLTFSLMNPLVFLLPVESGERVSLGMTILLSYAIFLTLVANSVPASSNPVCALLLVMILIMIMSGITVICVIVCVYYYYIDDISDIHSYLRRLALCFKRAKSRQYSKSDKSNDKMHVTGKDLSKCLDILFLVVSYVFLIVVITGYFIYVLAM